MKISDDAQTLYEICLTMSIKKIILIIFIILLVILSISNKPLLRIVCRVSRFPNWCENLEIWGCHYAWDQYHCHKICNEYNEVHCTNKCELKKPIPVNCPVHIH